MKHNPFYLPLLGLTIMAAAPVAAFAVLFDKFSKAERKIKKERRKYGDERDQSHST